MSSPRRACAVRPIRRRRRGRGATSATWDRAGRAPDFDTRSIKDEPLDAPRCARASTWARPAAMPGAAEAAARALDARGIGGPRRRAASVRHQPRAPRRPIAARAARKRCWRALALAGGGAAASAASDWLLNKTAHRGRDGARRHRDRPTTAGGADADGGSPSTVVRRRLTSAHAVRGVPHRTSAKLRRAHRRPAARRPHAAAKPAASRRDERDARRCGGAASDATPPMR